MRSIVERWFEAGDSGDLGRFEEVLAPDVVVHAPMGLSSRGTGRPFRLDQMVLVHVADDRIVEAWEIADLSPLWGGAVPADAADEPA